MVGEVGNLKGTVTQSLINTGLVASYDTSFYLFEVQCSSTHILIVADWNGSGEPISSGSQPH